MRTFSQNFREAIRGIRRINAKIDYQSKNKTITLTTEDSVNIQTETKLLGTEKGYQNLDKEYLVQVNPIISGAILKTFCNSLMIESTIEIPKKTWVHCEIGVKVGENFEYMDFGNFYVIDEPIFNADTNTYTCIAYDKMSEAMIKYDEYPLHITFPISHKNFIIAICNKFGWNYELPTYDIEDIEIVEDIYIGQDMTYRDVLDDLCVPTGGSFIFNNQDKFVLKKPINTQQVVTDEDLKSVNVDLGEIYGPVNSVMLALDSEDNVLEVIGQDTSSISQNGKTEMVLYSKLLLSSSGRNFFTATFNNLKDLTYSVCDFDSTGLLIFEPLDKFIVRYKNIDYPCILFNDDIKVTQGLMETIYSEKPEENKEIYTTSTPKTSQIKDAIVEVNKSKGQLVLKATADGRIVKAELTADAEEGSQFNVKADNINLEGYTTINGGFNIDENGSTIIRDGNIQLFDNDGDDTVLLIRGLSAKCFYRSNAIGMSNSTTLSSFSVWCDGGNTDGLMQLSDGNNTISLDPSGISEISGNLEVYGNLQVYGSKNRVIPINDKEKVYMNAYETLTAYFGDIGSSKTDSNGYCKIEINNLFKQTVKIDNYKVFIQKCGPGDLYVKKYKNYFEVIGTQNLEFDWEIKAIQKDFK